MAIVRTDNGQFAAGWRGGPGRPLGKRNYLTELALKALADDFAEHGIATIQRVREQRPHHYLSIVASLLPRQLTVERSSPFSDLSDVELQQLEQYLRASRARPIDAKAE